MPDGHRLRGVSTLVDSAGRPVMQWIKSAEDREAREEALALALERLPERVPVCKTRVRPPAVADADLCAVYPVGDPHIGLLAWGAETGDDHDLKIAESDLCAAFDLLVSETPRCARGIVAFLGDNVHADDYDSRTRRSGHRLDTDSRYPRVLDVALRTSVYAVLAALRAHQNVDVDFTQGNHDDHTALFLQRGLHAYFRLEPRVRVNLDPARYHYYTHGRNLFGFYHGHEVKHERLPGEMATSKPEAWGLTDHRRWFVGHIHTSRVHEYPGCTVETFRTLAARDSFASEHAYRSERTLTRIVYHAEDGEVFRSTADIGRIRKWAQK